MSNITTLLEIKIGEGGVERELEFFLKIRKR